jgi:S-DNA-T family DNA segregation ATPase FtsK/SpoIIIE
MFRWIAEALAALLGAIILWCLKVLAQLALYAGKQAIRHPRTSLASVLIGAAVMYFGWQAIVIALGVMLVAGAVWRSVHRDSFDAYALRFARTWWRRWCIYHRRWQRTMRRSGLAVEEGDQLVAPVLQWISSGRYWDNVIVRMQIGQDVADFEAATGRLRHAFKTERCVVTEVKPSCVALDFMRRDPFRYESCPATPIPAELALVDFAALPIGLTEQLTPFYVSVVGGHLSAAGSTGAGKAGVAWNVLRALAPAIVAGLVRPVFIDPKRKELRYGISLVKSGVYGSKWSDDARAETHPGEEPTGDYAATCRDTVQLLRRLVAEMEEANEAQGEGKGERDFVPTLEHPLVLVVIDEFAPLLAYWPRKWRDKIEELLGLLLTQGRAAGYIMIGAIQEPTKDIFKVRDLFGRRLALRLPTASFTDAALAEDATDRGAECHKIPESLPGVLFSLLDGAAKITRARLGHVRDDDIDELVEYVRRGREAARFTARTSTNTLEVAA